MFPDVQETRSGCAIQERLTLNSPVSSSNDMTSAPTMGAHFLRVMMLRTMGLLSPCTVTMLAIWITGSFSASGKQPCTASHVTCQSPLNSSYSLCTDGTTLTLPPHELPIVTP